MRLQVQHKCKCNIGTLFKFYLYSTCGDTKGLITWFSPPLPHPHNNNLLRHARLRDYNGPKVTQWAFMCCDSVALIWHSPHYTYQLSALQYWLFYFLSFLDNLHIRICLFHCDCTLSLSYSDLISIYLKLGGGLFQWVSATLNLPFCCQLT